MMTGIYFCGYCGKKKYKNTACTCRKTEPKGKSTRTLGQQARRAERLKKGLAACRDRLAVKDAALAAAEARIAYLDQLASERLEQMTADAEKIAELETALEPFAEESKKWEAGVFNSNAPMMLRAYGRGDPASFTIGHLRRAAALLDKEDT